MLPKRFYLKPLAKHRQNQMTCLFVFFLISEYKTLWKPDANVCMTCLNQNALIKWSISFLQPRYWKAYPKRTQNLTAAFQHSRWRYRGKRNVNVYTTCLKHTIRKRAHQVPKTNLLETANKIQSKPICMVFLTTEWKTLEKPHVNVYLTCLKPPLHRAATFVPPLCDHKNG